MSIKSRVLKAPPSLEEETLHALEFSKVLELFSFGAQTEVGKDFVRNLQPLDASQLETHFKQLDRWFAHCREGHALRLPSIPQPGFFKRNPALNPFEAAQLRTLRDLLVCHRDICRNETLAFALDGLPQERELAPLRAQLEGLFEANGTWRKDVSPRYGQLLNGLERSEQQLQTLLSQLIDKHAARLSEPLVYERNGRKVLGVKMDFKGRVKGILQDFSASGRTAYMEPQETTGLQNKLSQMQMEMEEELWRIRVAISEALHEHRADLEALCERLAQMDALHGLAKIAQQAACQVVTPNRERDLHLINARHPFLDTAFAPLRMRLESAEEADNNRMVPFSLSLNDDLRGLVISGANTGGKTVTLKTTGLLCLMARYGLPVPVDEASRIPFYAGIFADIGDHQSLSYNLSTYASHLVNLRQILEAPDQDCLVLLDELGSGTDPGEGNALSQAVIEIAVSRGFHLMVTTHQQILCTLALNHPHLENGSMQFDPVRLAPTYRFYQGVPGRSHALDIAKLAGIPDAVLARAHQLVDDNQMDIQEAIKQLQEQRKVLEKQRHKTRKEELKFYRRSKEAKTEQKRLEELQEELRLKEKEKLAKTIEKSERKLRGVLEQLEGSGGRRGAVKKFSKTRREIMAPYQEDDVQKLDVETTGLEPDQWKAGDPVLVNSFNIRGKLVRVDGKKARVDCNGKQLTVELKDLFHLQPSPSTTEKSKTQVHAESPEHNALYPVSELNLLGFRVEDALLELEGALDRALRNGQPYLRIIHGHGTGALKQAVRDFLKKFPAKNQFETQIDPGHDGVTDLKFSAGQG